MRKVWRELISCGRRPFIAKFAANIRLDSVMAHIKPSLPMKPYDRINAIVTRSTVSEHFKTEALAKISQFCAAMGLDCTRHDILRYDESPKFSLST